MKEVKTIYLHEHTKTLTLFPRTQCKGMEPLPVDADGFEAETMTDGKGNDYQAIVQREYPRMVFQVLKPESEKQFDEHLGILLGIGCTPVYIEGRTDFIVIFQGSLDFVELNQNNYKQVAANIKETRKAAACWWHAYGG